MCYFRPLIGTLPPKKFYRLNIISWIVMGCDIARFGQRGPKNHLNFGLKVCPPVTSRGAAPGPREVVPWNLEGCLTSGLEGGCHRTLRGAAQTSRYGVIGPFTVLHWFIMLGCAFYNRKTVNGLMEPPREVPWCRPSRSEVRRPSRSCDAAS